MINRVAPQLSKVDVDHPAMYILLAPRLIWQETTSWLTWIWPQLCRVMMLQKRWLGSM